MAFLLNIHPDDPQPRLLRQAAELLRKRIRYPHTASTGA